MRRLLSVLAAVLVLSLWAAPAGAQSQATTAEINGHVTDAQGGVLPGVTVTIINPATGYTRTMVTSAEGLFVVPLVPPGNYEVRFELTGFATGKGLAVATVGSAVTLNHVMQVGGLQESVTVTSQSSLVETSATVRTSTVNLEAIQNLPINGRRFQDFVTLTPTVQVDPQRGQLSFSGQRGINANVQVDGADFNQPFFGGIRGGERSNNAFTVPQEAIQEFQVVAAGYSAEFGRSTGGLVNAITKSGTNSLHGSAFYLNRNKRFAESNAFGQKAAPTQQQFGGSVGGPITKDRLFFFGAYEQQTFTNTRQVLFDRLLGFTPASATQEAFNYYKALEEPFDTTNDAWTMLGRADYQMSSANRLSLRYSQSANKALNANATGNALDPNTISALTNNGTEKDRTNIIVGQYTSTLTSRLLLEARGQWGYEERPRESNSAEVNVTNAIGRYGSVNFLPNKQFDKRFQATVNLTGLYGAHTLKVGTEFNHVFVDQTFGFNQFGVFNTTGTSTATLLDTMTVGGSIANRFDATTVTYLRQIGNLRLEFPTNEVAFFAQDSWKLKPNVSVNYGIRWEGAFNPTPDANNDFMVNAVKNATFPLGRTLDPTQIPDQTNQWGPRAGFAWDVANDGKTVIRGYSGIYYARTPSLLYAAPMNNFRVPAGDLSLQLPFAVPAGNPNNTVYKQLKLIGIDLNTYSLGALPQLTAEQVASVAAALGLNVNPYFGAQPILMDKDFKNPRATQAGLGIEREIMNGLAVGADFSYVKTDRLQRNREFNLPVPVAKASDPSQRAIFGLTSGVARPLTSLGSVQVRESTAKSDYKALALTSRLRKQWGQVNVSYVLSKSMSDDDNERDSGGIAYENTYDLGAEWGPSRLDRRHQFSGSVVLNLPYSLDWSSGFRFLSARPIDATLGSDVNGDRNTTERPFSAPGVSFTRNSFRNESLKFFNMRLQWNYKMGDQRRLVLSAEVFNVFNWENIELAGTTVTNYCAAPIPQDCGFGSPTNPNFLSLTDQNPLSATFGTLLRNNTPGDPRQIQLGIRFLF